MRNALLWIVLAGAVGAVVWFFLGDSLGLGTGPDAQQEFSEDGELLEGDEAVTLAATGTGAAKKDAADDPAHAKMADPLALGGFVVRGRCVNETRHPVQANVVVSMPGGASVEALTGADGRFEVALGELPEGAMQARGAVVATADGNLAAFHLFWVWTKFNRESTDAGVVVMRKGQPLSVRVTNGGAPVANARVAVYGSGNWGNRALFAEDRTDDSGLLSLAVVPPGTTTVVASGDAGTGRGETTVTIPRTDTLKPLDVELTDERTLDVEVVDKETGAPVAGAKILAGDNYGQPPPAGDGYRPTLEIAPTDAEGRTQVRSLGTNDKTRLWLSVDAEGYPSGGTSFGRGRGLNSKRLKASETEVRFELVRLRTVTFPIEPGDTPAPADGTMLEVENSNFGMPSGTSDTVATIRDGDLVIEGLSPSHVAGTVTSEDGHIAKFNAPANKTEGKPVTFTKGKVLQLRVLDMGGQPAADINVALQGRGAWKIVGPVKTDANGEATLPATDLKVGDVKVLQNPSQWWSSVTVDSVDLSKHEGVLVVKLPPESQLTVALKLDGKARLPATYWLSIDNRYMSPNSFEENPGTGELVVPLRLPDGEKPITVSMSADGYLPVNEKIERADLGKPVVLDLKPSATIIVRYTKPEDGRFSLVAERWDAKQEKWIRTWGQNNNRGRQQRPKEENTQRFEGLTEGRYRIVESRSKLTTDPFEVALRAPPAEVDMDMSVLTYTEGRIEVPEGFKVSQARVVNADGPSSTGRRRGGTGISKDGSFKMRAIRGQPLTLTVSHPLLVPAKAGGIVKTKGGARGVVLKLQAGGQVHFKVAGLKLANSEAWTRRRAAMERAMAESGDEAPMIMDAMESRTPISFRVYPGGTFSGEMLRSGSPIAEDGVLRIGGLEPGVYSLFLERSGYAPKRIRGIELGDAIKDLGTVDFSKGASITVTLKAADGKPVPNCWASAQSLDKPAYNRSASNRGKSEFSFKGLGAGRFKVTIHAQGSSFGGGRANKLFDDEVTLDGSNDLSLIVDVKE